MINLAKNYNNEYRLSVAYHIKGVLYKRKKKYDQVLEYYNKSKKLKEKIGDQSSLAIIYNGIGSFHFLVENYEQAYDYYNQALDSLRITKDYHEIGMTCYNLALTLFFAQEYEEAIFYLNKIIDILKESQVKKLLYHTKIRIYILLGINYLKIGNFNKVQECIIKIDNRSIKDTTGEARNNLDFFLLEFLTALIFKAESNYQEAEKHFDWAIKLCNDIEENNQYLYPKLYYEYGLMCEELGSVEKANNLFKRGLKYCKKLEYNFYKGLILSEINREPVKIDKFNFSKSNFDFDWIPESVELEETLDKLYQQMDKINFLNNLQNTLMKTSDNKDLAEKTMELIEDNFLIEANYLYLKEEGTWKNYFTNDEEVNFDFDVQKFINLLIAEGTERIILNPRQDYSQEVVGNFNSLIFVPLESETEVIGCIICATISKELVLSNDSLKILSIVAKQLSIALERIERNQELKDAYQQLLVSSKTDSLTGVYNRWELRNKLESEMERSRRYGKKYAVLFIDLDNFKYYNDEFGHDIGDLVLCEFAKLLEESVRKTDFVSRFGGDEFVLVLPETTADKAYLLAERIQNRLIEVNHFQPVIEKEIGEKIEIPPKIN
nr:diguanylate cyclase [Halanaerobacter jeridensis]